MVERFLRRYARIFEEELQALQDKNDRDSDDDQKEQSALDEFKA